MLKFQLMILSPRIIIVPTWIIFYLFADLRLSYAHGFGDRYDLPVPLNWYLFGAGTVVALSFLFVSVFVRITSERRQFYSLSIGSSLPFQLIIFKGFIPLAKSISVVLFLFLILGGFVGSQEPSQNIGPTLVWIILWVGLIYFNALVFNLWIVLNPWKNIYRLFYVLFTGSRSKLFYSGKYNYPNSLKKWPALVLLFTFSWLEIVFPNSGSPVYISVLAINYSILTFLGMYLFGPINWLSNGEFFSVTFRLLSKCAPVVVSVSSVEGCRDCSRCLDDQENCFDCEYCFDQSNTLSKRFKLRKFASGLYDSRAVHLSEIFFVLMLLSSVTFDGFSETPTWANIVSLGISFTGDLVNYPVMLVSTVGLVSNFLIFVVAYFLACFVASKAIASKYSTESISKILLYSLIPIAVGYHIAHYFSFLLIQGQSMIYLISDPMGLGWDLFQTSTYKVYVGIVNAKVAWFVGIFAILAGHITAVYASHYASLIKFSEYSLVIRAQRVMLIMMVAYTIAGLWILAQPIIEIS